MGHAVIINNKNPLPHMTFRNMLVFTVISDIQKWQRWRKTYWLQ